MNHPWPPFPQRTTVGCLLPLAAPGGEGSLVRLGSRETSARARAHEERFERLLELFAHCALDPVVLGSSDPYDVQSAFRQWADGRPRR